MVKHHEKLQPGLDVIEKALESMTKMADHINEMKRKHERTVRIQEIQSILYGYEGADLTTYGDLVLEVRGSSLLRRGKNMLCKLLPVVMYRLNIQNDV